MPAASKDPTAVQSPGLATHFTIHEGGRWHEWEPDKGIPKTQTGIVFAVKFESGWIWDQLVGWRFPRD